MKFELGQRLMWVPARPYEPRQEVSVVRVSSRGEAKLSNGWTVDTEGVAEGTKWVPGGRVEELVT